MKTITYLVGYCEGGIKKHVRHLVDYFSHRYRVILMVPGNSVMAEDVYPAGVAKYELPPKKGTASCFYQKKYIMQILRHEKPDLVHIHGLRMALGGRWITKFTRSPCLVVTMHSFPEYGSRKVKGEVLLRTWETLHQPLVSRYLCVSQALANYLGKNLGVGKKKISVIYNGIDPFPFEKAVLEKERNNNKPKGYLVGTVARLAPQKGVEVFLKAISRLDPDIFGLTSVIIGDGPRRESLEKLAFTLGVRERVIFTGYLDDLASGIAAMDILVIPSLSEGLSITLLEGLAAARPVIASEIGGVPEIITEGDTGLLFPPGDDAKLAEKIAYLLRNSQLRRAMGAKGQKKVKKFFSLDSMLRETESVYQELLFNNFPHTR